MSAPKATSFQKDITYRLECLDEMSQYLKNYRPDARNLMNRVLDTPFCGMRKSLHQVVSNLYDDMVAANKAQQEDRRDVWKLYRAVKEDVIQHIAMKSSCGKDLEALRVTDIWMARLVAKEDGGEYLMASDHVSDVLCLAKISISHKLPADKSQLSEAITRLVETKINTYFNLLGAREETAELQKRCISLFQELDKTYRNQEFENALRIVDDLSSLMKK